MIISVGRFWATVLIGTMLAAAFVVGCGGESDEAPAGNETAANASPDALATAAPVLDNKRWRPGTGVRRSGEPVGSKAN